MTRASEVCVSAMAVGHNAGFAAPEDANLSAERLVAPLRSRDIKFDFVSNRDLHLFIILINIHKILRRRKHPHRHLLITYSLTAEHMTTQYYGG